MAHQVQPERKDLKSQFEQLCISELNSSLTDALVTGLMRKGL